MKAVIIGPPGAGKGSVAEYFKSKYCIPHLSTGDVFRAEISRETELGRIAKTYIDRGELVPDDIVIEIVKKTLSQMDLSRGVILDGYPRTLKQAEALDSFLEIDVAIYVYIPEEVAIERLSNRYVCPICNKIYNLKFNPPKNDLTCDQDGAKLYRRSDDEPDIVRERYRVYYQQSKAVIDYYRSKRKLVEVDNSQNLEFTIGILEKILISNGILKLKPCR
ncbi:MAG: nucleoside monophosphate kinase [Desulfurococcaceae archaeon]|uniref:Adenylate kinase n=1 Tax=Staphylothermus marinus TaxID=2280 RepID=A0A7C4HC50_STAMA